LGVADDAFMRVTFLGTGTSHGIPMIGCDCDVCRSDDPRNQRLRPSILVEEAGTTVLVDATPDFRTQALRARLRRLDAVLLTHTHADHFLGLDDLRAFSERQDTKIPVYGTAVALDDVRRVFHYACTDRPSWASLPRFDLRQIESGCSVEIGKLSVRSMVVPHGRATVLGFVFGNDFAYLTDCSAVPPEVVQATKGLPALALDGLRHRPHPTHLTVADAVTVAAQIGAGLTLLTHMCHDLDHAVTERTLPPGVRLAYDGMRIEIEGNDWQIVD
jgi:phosphoribosyl 1,2-cyclic phosphate phosphodiesterase